MKKQRLEKSESISLNEYFRKFAQRSSAVLGSPWAFAGAITAIAVWAAVGPRFKYSDTWQLVINTSTTIITFLMVFLIQNSQNRDAKALHLKLDELLLAVKGARNHLIDLENMSEEELTQLQKEFCNLQKKARKQLDEVEEVKEEKRAARRGR